MSLDCKRSWQQRKPKRLEKECSFCPIMETGISDRCRVNCFNSHRMNYLSRGGMSDRLSSLKIILSANSESGVFETGDIDFETR
jgi:hypothetical protein